MPQVDVTLVIVGIQSKRYVEECLASLGHVEWGPYTHHTIYVDNASTDGSVEMVRRDFADVAVIANTRNEGFCRACNQGAAAVASRYVYLLNNDTVLFADSVAPLIAFLDRTPRAAVAGNRLLNPDLTDQWSARRFPAGVNAFFGRRTLLARRAPDSKTMRHYLYKDEMALGEPFTVDWVPGSCSLVRREAYDQVGGLPEEMHYWSDAVFCDRLRRAGWDAYIVPKARLVHYEGQGTGGKSRELRQRLITDFHNGAYRFYCEHYGLTPAHPARWLARIGLDVRARVLVAAVNRSFRRH